MTPNELVAFAEGLARIAAAGGGPKALAHHLAEMTHAGVLVEDAEWRHVATAGSAVGLPATVRDLLGGETEPGHAPRALRGRQGRCVPIEAGDARLGWLTVFGPSDNGSLDGLDLALRLAAATMAVELAREAGGGRGRRRSFWERLIARSYHDFGAARDDATSRGIVLASHYVAVALEVDVSDESRAAAAIADLRAVAVQAFASGEADLGILERGASLLLLIPAQRELEASNARTAATLLPRTVGKQFPAIGFYGGVGTAAPVAGIHRSIEQADAALTIGRRLYGPGRVAVYDDLGAYALLLEGADTARLRAFAQHALAPLRAYDEKHQTELEKTLRLYFEVGQNVKTAAERLNVHRHTVFYRLRQIGDICSRSLDDAHDQLTLRMAMAIDAIQP
jgi:purine catabolism regulator